ncbi:hypothetical protein N7509_005217 [Penicillium cosmopolitanum]|uniref:Uncharacterized protein n=1 Tax=Penicillium cosmopolitanum TaxID=1131564 RepID=A0A9W9W1S1_9EURO|nr:uncharacterized protein N7509_005217 [Penicillium cosmopolitanum]KAJ5397104.1 hypothetical protein N7509_005217 [Penicillium cosmopolitanum]
MIRTTSSVGPRKGITQNLHLAIAYSFYDCPRPRCETCLPVDIYDAPGVGFDLTPSYGTSAVHYYNGTVVEVVQIYGKHEYLELMIRLAKGGKPVLIEDQGIFQNLYFRLFPLLDSFLGVPFPARAGWRWLNEKLKRPVELEVDDINIISEMLWNLKLATEKQIHQDLNRVAITTPDIQTLSSDVINTALQELDLQTWTGDCSYYPKRLVEADAVYAANGYGLCKRYHDLWQCTDEFGFEWVRASSPIILFVSFTRHLLYTSITIPDSGEAFVRFACDEIKALNFELGLDRILEADDPDLLWARLREQITSFALSFRITDFLLAGESTTNPLFMANLKDALAGLLELHIEPKIAASAHGKKAIDLTFAAARGAALYARRRQEVQCDCSELEECESSRQKERAGGQVKLDL